MSDSKPNMIPWVFGGSLLILIVVGRTLPHLPNFAPVAAAGLFAGYLFANRGLAIGFILAAMLVSDLILGFESVAMRVLVYAAFVLPVFLGALIRRPSDGGWKFAGSVLGLGLASSLVFFLVTNFGVWLFSGMYTHDWAGLGLCFLKAIPFYRATMAGDLFYLVVFFGLHALATRRVGVAAASHA